MARAAPKPVVNLLHLSDLHFGYDRDATARRQRAEALDGLLDIVAGLDAASRPHLIAISGDLTYQGKPAGYTELATWLTEKLLPAAGLAAQDLIVCPGNHDIDRKKTKFFIARTQIPAEADDLLRAEDLADGFATAFPAYTAFAQSFGIPAPSLLGQPNHLAGALDHAATGLRFLILNSAWFCRDSGTDRANLWLGLPQLQALDLLKPQPQHYNTAPITIALVHHPIEWFAGPDLHSYDNRPAAYGYLAERCHAILSGHTHGAIVRPTRLYDRAWAFLNGAAYDSHAYRNNFSLLQIDTAARTIHRRNWELDPRGPRWEEKADSDHALHIAATTGRSRQAIANPARYVAWLRDQTSSIKLEEMKLAPGEVPPPSIDALYIRLKSRSPRGSGNELNAPESRGLEELLAAPGGNLVIEGEPGSGKTTFLRWLAWQLCRPQGPPPGFAVQDRLPLFIRISLLDQHIVKTTAGGGPPTPADPRWLPHYLAHQGWDLDEAFFAEKLAQPETLLLLDGLDEAATADRRVSLVALIQNCAAHYGCRIVVTTRPGVHQGRATLTGFAPHFIEDLDAPGIEGFLRQWCFWLKRGDAPAAEAYFQELQPAVSVPGIRHLARNPLMLTCLAVVYLRRHRLPQQRARLYEEILDWLAEQAATRHPVVSKEERLDRFSRLALAMQTAKGGQKLQLGIDDAARAVSASSAQADLTPLIRFFEQAQVDSGIVTLRGVGEIAFWHRIFQEHLAARALSCLPDAKLAALARPLLYKAEGREVLPLLGGLMATRGKERLDDLLAALTEHAVSRKKLADQAHAVGILGRLLSDVEPAGYALSAPASARYAKLRSEVMAIFEKGQAAKIGVKTRVAAAEALDQASQDRLPLPGQGSAYWICIPGGTLITGDRKAFASLPAGEHKIKAFWIGKYPVTVWEYGKYLEATDAEKPKEWEEQEQHPGRPVVHVSWHDANRYCEWVTGSLGFRVSLPHDLQWEFAARGTTGRVYPWGVEKLDQTRANVSMTLGAPSPVGVFPDGATTPEGIMDMLGNVWEWTTSDWCTNHKAVRGGSFHDNDDINLRVAARNGDGPGSWGSDLGFRCVRE